MTTLAIVLPFTLALGVLLGLYGERLGLSGGLRALVIALSATGLSKLAADFAKRREIERNR